MKENEYLLCDKDIRTIVFQTFQAKNTEMRLMEEFPMGDSRADLLLVTNTKLIGLEIKSDRDTFVRLPRQIKDYERFFDVNYLVVGTYHVEEAIRTVPSHWGIYEVYEQENGGYALECIRSAALSLKDNMEEKLYLLWRNELNQIIRDYRLSGNTLHRKDKMIVKIMKNLSGPVIQSEICRALRTRDYSKYREEKEE